MTADGHRALREQLGGYVLGHLGDAEAAALRAHLAGCPSCQEALAELAPLAEALREVDVTRVAAAAGGETAPPAGLGEAIVRRHRAESVRRQRQRTRRRFLVGGVAAGALSAAAVAGLGLGIALRPPSPPPVPLEPVAVQIFAPAVDATANLVNHTWGVEVKLVGTGFVKGRTYRAFVEDERGGRLVSAGSFVGVGEKEMKCNLNSSVLRPDAAGFVVRADAGDAVLRSVF